MEIYRGDFQVKTQRLYPGISSKLELRSDLNVDHYPLSGISSRFHPNVWRIIFDHSFCGVVEEIRPYGEIRAPRPEEVPEKKIIAYGTSITHSAGAGFFTNSYIAHIAKHLGADVLCKGMGASCYCEPEIAKYLGQAEWDLAILELSVNMLGKFSNEEYKERVKNIIINALYKEKPVIAISHFTHYNDLPGAECAVINEEYVQAMQEICREIHSPHLYYIDGRKIIEDFTWLGADLIHPTAFGHCMIGNRLADLIRNEYHLL